MLAFASQSGWATTRRQRGTTVDADAAKTPQRPPRQVSARELLGPERILRIEHNGEIYTLRLTRNDRLILTK
jgi:hemin uptake protein HemP